MEDLGDAACGAERHCRMLVVRADHTRNGCACWRAVFFLRPSTHASVARTLRPLCTAVERERMVIPTRNQPLMRGLPHIAENLVL